MASCKPKFVLDITHLDLVLRTLERHHYEPRGYFDLGITLKLLENTLKDIQINHCSDVKTCLRECLSAWLRKKDNVTETTWEALISALRLQNENGIADLIERENFLPLYDRSDHGDISNEEHAVNIFERHERTFRKHLRNPKNVATLLRQEDNSILPKDLDMSGPLKMQRNLLELELRKAIGNNFTVLWKFILVCKHTSNEDVSEALRPDYENTFQDESPSKAQMKLKSTAMEFAEAICRDDAQCNVKLRSCLKQYRLKFPFGTQRETIGATADDIIRNLECTPYNIAPLEEFARELKPFYPKAYKCIKDHVQYMQESDISIASFDPANSQTPSLKMERLIINFKCTSVTTIQEWEIMLNEIFGPSLSPIVKLQGFKANTIFAVFSPELGTLLINKIREKQDYCWDKQIMEVTVGYCQERIGDKEDLESIQKEWETLEKVYEEKIRNLEEIIEEQKIRIHEMKNLKREKRNPLTQHANLMQEKLLLEENVTALINVKERYENSIQCLHEQLAVFEVREREMKQQLKTVSEISKAKSIEIKHLRNAVQEQKKELEIERTVREEKNVEIENLKNTVQVQNEEKQALKSTIEQKDGIIPELKETCDKFAVSTITSEETFKVILLGDSCVGKTCLVRLYVDRKVHHLPRITVYLDIALKKCRINGIHINLHLWDTAGMEQYRQSLIHQYYRNLDGAIFVYDITRRESFEHLEDWFSEMRQYTPTEEGRIKCILLGNKSDLKDHREVSIEEGRAFAEAHGMLFSEITAKSNDCLNTLDTFIERLLQQMLVAREEDNLKLALAQSKNDVQDNVIRLNSQHRSRHSSRSTSSSSNNQPSCC